MLFRSKSDKATTSASLGVDLGRPWPDSWEHSLSYICEDLRGRPGLLKIFSSSYGMKMFETHCKHSP